MPLYDSRQIVVCLYGRDRETGEDKLFCKLTFENVADFRKTIAPYETPDLTGRYFAQLFVDVTDSELTFCYIEQFDSVNPSSDVK